MLHVSHPEVSYPFLPWQKGWHDRDGSYILCTLAQEKRGAVMKIQPRYSKEEFARRGDAIYERELPPMLEKGNEGKFVAIDIETGACEIDADELAASDRLVARVPNAQIWLRRIGSRPARRFGSHPRSPIR